MIRLKMKIILSGEEDFFGPGVCRFLKTVDETGSMHAAAERMGMSYSKCLKLINRAEEQAGIRFVDRINGGKHGGSSSLTKEGRDFLERYEALSRELQQTGEELFAKYFDDIRAQ